MAQKVSVVLLDDLDESEASETLSFSLDGQGYEIDLNDQHAKELRDAFAPYVGAGRKAGRSSAGGSASTSRPGRSRSAAAAGGDRERVQAIREWARAHGHAVSERGRLSSTVMAAYDAAH